jgi:hypothetical protein
LPAEAGASPEAYTSYASLSLKQQKKKNHAGNEEVDMQVDKLRSNGKKEKEKVHVSAGEWGMFMSAINHGTDVPANSRREVLMGYQYAAPT